MHAQDQWASYQAAGGASKQTIGLRRRVLNALLTHANRSDPLALTELDVLSFLGRDIAPWTRLTYWRAIREWSQFCVTTRLDPDSDLTRLVPRPRTPKDAPRPLGDDAIEELLSANLSQRTRDYVLLCLYQALRVHEVAKVRGDDMDLSAGLMFVTGKGGQTACIPLHPQIAEIAERKPKTDWWFPSPKNLGQPVGAMAVTHSVGSAIRSIGRKGTAHQLRHAAATRMQRQAKDIRLTQALLRHASVNTTQRYAAVCNNDLQAAVRKLQWQTRTEQSNVVPLFRSRPA